MQTELNFGHPARKTDPAESHIAANMINFRNAHFKAILHVLTEPMGKSKIALFSGLTDVQVGRRLKEMAKAELIETTGNQVNSTSNRPEREWRKII